MQQFPFFEREEAFKDYMRRYSLFHQFQKDLGILDDPNHPLHMIVREGKYCIENGPIFLHRFAFEPAVLLLGSEEQANKWLPLMRQLKIIGAYSQTELGHGSDVQSLMTTATYDPETQEFIFNTPDIKAYKFFPAGIGKVATFQVLFARLITKGKDHGVQAFLIQTRDLKTHLPLPGVEQGDIGSKIAF